MKTYFAVSDIHGRHSDFVGEFTNIGFDATNEDHIMIFLGDYFDRGKQNAAVLKELLSLKEQYGDRCILLRGNHDVNFHAFLTSMVELSPLSGTLAVDEAELHFFKENGGGNTLKEFFPNKKFNKEKQLRARDMATAKTLLEFLDSLEDYYVDNKRKVMFLHASAKKQEDGYFLDYEDRNFIHRPVLLDGYMFLIGHTPIPFLLDHKDLTLYQINNDPNQTIVMNSVVDNGVMAIDNGYGDNFIKI